MGCDPDIQCSPAVERKVVAAATRNRSYAEASDNLSELAELGVSAKQCERIAQRIGQERVAEVEQRCDAFDKQPLLHQKNGKPADAPANSWNARAAVASPDGGRSQYRDERWGTPKKPGEKRSWWCEPKIALMTTVASEPSTEDPLPEVPDCLLNPLFVIPRVMEIKRARGGDTSEKHDGFRRSTQDSDDASLSHDDASSLSEDASLCEDASARDNASALEPPPSNAERWSPEPLVRSVVGTFGSYDKLGRLMEVEAWHRGFAQAERKAFVADGHLANWGIHRKRFSDYTPVVDLMHAMAYVYTAAVESSPDVEAAWERFSRWIQWVWQGDVAAMIDELQPLAESAEDASSRKALSTCLTYLRNNASRMRYAEYRRAGLPITTVLCESAIKQINRRMKSTEKFWRPGAEPQLQLCCDQLSETRPLAAFWTRRSENQTGFRKPRTKT